MEKERGERVGMHKNERVNERGVKFRMENGVPCMTDCLTALRFKVSLDTKMSFWRHCGIRDKGISPHYSMREGRGGGRDYRC